MKGISNAALEKLVWLFIYGGLLVFCVGLFIKRGDAAWGWTLVIAGAAAAVFGALLIYWRSRRQ